ncbi:MAG: RDD family protein, partial [Actinomycetota bacterium]
MTATLHPRRLAAPTRHRLAAAVTDLVIVAIPPLAVALLASERFRLLDPTAEPVRVRPADQAALDQLLAGFHRQTEWNGWLHVIDGPGLAGIAAALVATVLVTQVLFPALGDGRSPGKGALGLRVVAATGRAATVRQHLRRTAVAPFDLLVWPLVVVARRLAGQSGTSPARLGDRLAGTRVTRIPRNWV